MRVISKLVAMSESYLGFPSTFVSESVFFSFHQCLPVVVRFEYILNFRNSSLAYHAPKEYP